MRLLRTSSAADFLGQYKPALLLRAAHQLRNNDHFSLVLILSSYDDGWSIQDNLYFFVVCGYFCSKNIPSGVGTLSLQCSNVQALSIIFALIGSRGESVVRLSTRSQYLSTISQPPRAR